jgi:hypothetical protein
MHVCIAHFEACDLAVISFLVIAYLVAGFSLMGEAYCEQSK